MMQINDEKPLKEAARRRWMPIAAATLAVTGAMALSLPGLSNETTVLRRVSFSNGGLTQTTTTTTTADPLVVPVSPAYQVVAPMVPGPMVQEVIVPVANPLIADKVLIETTAPAATTTTTTTTETVEVPVNSAASTTTTTVEKVVVPAGTTAIQKVIVDAPVIRQTLSDRQARLRAFIASGLASGSMTAAEADAFRRELDRLAAQEATLFASKQVTYERVLPLAFEYDLIGTNLKVVDVKPFVQGGTVVLTEAHVVPFDDLMRRRAGLEAKISYQAAIGKLNSNEVNRLRGMLDHVAVMEGGFRGDGEITDREAKTLYTEFDRVGSAIDRAI